MNEELTVPKLLAMAPMDDILDCFRQQIMSKKKTFQDSDTKDPPDFVSQQEFFARSIESCWTVDGQSKRYLKKLIKGYIAFLESQSIPIESDELMGLVFRASLTKEAPPDGDESNYLSFRIPNLSKTDQIDSSSPILRIRVYPYHNDVALRLWEAGAYLTEFLLQYPSYVRDKYVLELGAGVGLTGLVIAGYCGTKGVHLTDYTEECRLNLEHNLEYNKKWLDAVGASSGVTQGYLEWGSFQCDSTGEKLNEDSIDPALQQTMINLLQADVLLGADILYDRDIIGSLVEVVNSFLMRDPKSKRAIFGITKRNQGTFDLFLSHLEKYGIFCDWLSDDQKITALPKIFHCKFNQPRTDIRIACLMLKES